MLGGRRVEPSMKYAVIAGKELSMLKRIWNDPVGSSVIGGLIVLSITGLGTLVISQITQDRILLPVTAVGLLALLTIALVTVRRLTGIDLDTSGYFLGMTGDGTKISIRTFQAKGRNKSNRPITKVAGHVRSNLTNETFPLYMNLDGNLVLPEDTNGIPPKSPFAIVVPFVEHPESEGLDEDNFLRRLADFTLNLDFDGERFSFHFSPNRVRRQVQLFRRQITPAMEPRVTRKVKTQS
jgi:hypothetical protein